MHKIIIFDFDGTLADSSIGIKTSIKIIVKKYNLKSLSEKELNHFISISPIQKAFQQTFNLSNNMAQKLSDEYRIIYNSGEMFKTELYDDTLKTLEDLLKNGYILGIATYKRQDSIDKIIEYLGIGKYFQVICGADKDGILTKKDILQNCINNLDVKKENVIYIGDSYHDSEAAQELGVKFIGVTYGFGFKNELEVEKYKPLYIANNVKELTNFLQKITGD